MPQSYRVARSISAALITAAFLQCVYLWSRLPDVIASRFDGNGTPTGWSGKIGFVGLYLAMLVLVWLALVVLPGRVLANRERPGVSHSDFRMTPEPRERAPAVVGAWLAWMAALNILTAFAIANMVFSANMNGTPLSRSIYFLLVAYFIAIGAWLFAFFKAFRLSRSVS